MAATSAPSTPVFTAQEARRALVTFALRAGPPLSLSMEHLRTIPVTHLEANNIAFGKWRCNLDERTFVVAVNAGPIFAQYAGIFHQDEEGVWVAQLTQEWHN